MAAGVVIAREAGAALIDADGERYGPLAPHGARAELVGSNGPVHDALLRHLDDEQDLRSAERTSAD